MDADEFDILYNLHHNRWNEELLGELFENTINRVLDKKERVILGLKVQLYEEGWSELTANKHIAKRLNIKLSTLKRCIYDIKFKMRNKMDRRVDNMLEPRFYYAKKRRRLKNESSGKNS